MVTDGLRQYAEQICKAEDMLEKYKPKFCLKESVRWFADLDDQVRQYIFFVLFLNFCLLFDLNEFERLYPLFACTLDENK